MADGRQEEAWWRGAFLASLQLAAAGGKVSDLNDLVPERYRRPPPQPTAEQTVRSTRSAVRLLGAFFGDPNP